MDNLYVASSDGADTIKLGITTTVTTGGSVIVDGGNGGVTAELSKVYTAGGINVALGGGLNVIDVEGSSALGPR